MYRLPFTVSLNTTWGKKELNVKKKQQIHGASDRTLSDGNNLTAAYMYVCLKH